MDFERRGATWTDRTAAGTHQWTSITSSSDGTKIAAVVDGGDIYTSTDGGATWTNRTTGTSLSGLGWRTITSSANGMKLAAAGDTSDIYTSTDGGITWTNRIGTDNWVAIASSQDGTHLVAAVYLGDIYVSTTSGATWTNETTGTAASGLGWTAVTSSSDGTKLAAVAGCIDSGCATGQDIWTSANSGATWTNRTTGTSESGNFWSAITSSSDGTKLLVGGDASDLYTSANSGASWTDLSSVTFSQQEWQQIISSADGTKLTAFSDGSGILTSTDGGNTWVDTSQGSIISNQQVSWLAASSDFTKLAAISGSDIYTSTDGGVTWTDRPAAGGRNWDQIFSSADGTKLAASAFGWQIFTSADSGVTWAGAGPATSAGAFALAMAADGSRIVGIDQDTKDVYVSTDNGATWTDETTLAGEYWIVTSSSDGMHIAAAATCFDIDCVVGGDIYTSTDGGITWTNRTTGTSLSGIFWNSITSSSDGTELVAVAFEGDIYISEDAGATWAAQTVPGSQNWASVTASADGTKLAAAANPGDIWTAIPTPVVSTPTPASNGAPAGALSPGALTSLPNYVKPRPQIRYPDGSVAYLDTAPGTPTTAASPAFSQNLQLNDSGPDIKALQQFLNTHGVPIATIGPGSPGNETDFFGVKTYQALIKFQKAHDLPATGYLGPLTRTLISQLQH